MKKLVIFAFLSTLVILAHAQKSAGKVISFKPVIIITKTSECFSGANLSEEAGDYAKKRQAIAPLPCEHIVYKYTVKDIDGKMHVVSQFDDVPTGRMRYILLQMEDGLTRLIWG